jgi:hypothetical protein
MLEWVSFWVVALVQNLHTGHVSPDHVVFDDKFETVFNDGKSLEELDKICAKLFVNSEELFVKDEEYDDDGILVYKPPPLDEVWLLEPERHERWHKLDKQHKRAAWQRAAESQEVKKRLKRSKPSLPDLAESDVDSDGKDSLCEEPQFESEGD